MRAMLNAMGATLWGVIAITLAAAVVVVGYRASLSYRSEYPTPSTGATAQPAGTEAVSAVPSPLSRAAARKAG